MRLSTTGLATAGAFVEDLKAFAKQSGTLQRLLWQAKTEMTRASQDITTFSRVTQTHPKNASSTGLWTRVWQSMQAVVASFRTRISKLLTNIQNKQHASQAGHTTKASHSHSHHKHAARTSSARFRPRSTTRNSQSKRLSSSALFSDIENYDEALFMIREIADGLLDDLSPDDLEKQLEHWIQWDKYPLDQQFLLQQAITQITTKRQNSIHF